MKCVRKKEIERKFDIGDKFYVFEEYLYYKGFNVKEYRVTDILIKEHNINMFKACDTRWFSEKECLTKEEAIEKINNQIEKIKKGRL